EAVPSGVEGETEGDGLGDGSMTPSEVEGLASGEGLGGATILMPIKLVSPQEF
ncbi:MAG: hypothetical protein UW74_C0044G0008, partial [Candidatus Giovannonibacteria bacterium GW2011_GWC2_44_8]